MPTSRPLSIALAASLALAASGVHAQGRTAAELPVWNRASGQVEAVLVLEPLQGASARPFSRAALNASFGTGAANQLGLVCGQDDAWSSIGGLVGNCLVASVDGRTARGGTASASASRGGLRLGMGISQRDQSLPLWMTPGSPASRVNSNALTVVGEKVVGREATVSVGGTLVRARLVSPSYAGLQDRWDMQSLSVGARLGRFSANVVGRVVDAPSDRWGGVDLGFSWRTPWKGQLSVGAENVVTRGRNPFDRSRDTKDEGTAPYVRYQQDL